MDSLVRRAKVSSLCHVTDVRRVGNRKRGIFVPTVERCFNPSSVMELTRQQQRGYFRFLSYLRCWFYLQRLGVKQMERAAPSPRFPLALVCGSSEGRGRTLETQRGRG